MINLKRDQADHPQAGFKRLLSQEEDGLERGLAFLREQGFSMVDTIRALVAAREINLDQAKRIVHTSGAWRDAMAAHDAFHDSLEREALRPTLGPDTPEREDR